MKQSLVVLFVLGVIACGCWSPPLQLKHYSKNIVVAADGGLSFEGKKITLKNLKNDLVSHMIFQNTPITIHFHTRVSREMFDTIVGKFGQEGFKKFDTTIYSD